MQRFFDLTLNGLASGAIYALVALSLVMIWRATRILNFAQAGMLMVTTFVAWSIVDSGGGYWLAFAAALGAGFALGAVTERVLIRHVEGAPPLNAVIVTLGLLVVLQAVAGMVWGSQPHSFPAAFSIRGYELGDHTVPFGPADLFAVLAVAAVVGLLVLLFRRTSIGLQMRASALAPEVARLLGIRVGGMFTLGWALASTVGALAGVLVAPDVFVSPTSFDAILIFGFTAAVLGGLESPPGAVVGGVVVGLALSYVSGYAGSSMVTLGSLAILVAVLMVRPNGLFATTRVRQV